MSARSRKRECETHKSKTLPSQERIIESRRRMKKNGSRKMSTLPQVERTISPP